MTIPAIILICAAAAVIELDNVSVAQTGVARPFMCGIIFGMLVGNVSAGAQLGIFLELLFLDFTPVGGVLPPNGTVAALSAVMAAKFGAPLYFAFFYGAAAGLIFRFVEMRMRAANGLRLSARQENFNDDPVKVINSFIFASLAAQIVTTFVFMLAAVMAAKIFMYYAIPVGENAHAAFAAAYMAAPWLGIFTLFRKFNFRIKT